MHWNGSRIASRIECCENVTVLCNPSSCRLLVSRMKNNACMFRLRHMIIVHQDCTIQRELLIGREVDTDAAIEKSLPLIATEPLMSDSWVIHPRNHIWFDVGRRERRVSDQLTEGHRNIGKDNFRLQAVWVQESQIFIFELTHNAWREWNISSDHMKGRNVLLGIEPESTFFKRFPARFP